MATQMEDEVVSITGHSEKSPEGYDNRGDFTPSTTKQDLYGQIPEYPAYIRPGGDENIWSRESIFAFATGSPFPALSLSSDLILILDKEQTVTYINDGFLNFLDMPGKNLTGKKSTRPHLRIISHPDVMVGIGRALEGKGKFRRTGYQDQGTGLFFYHQTDPDGL